MPEPKAGRGKDDGTRPGRTLQQVHIDLLLFHIIRLLKYCLLLHIPKLTYRTIQSILSRLQMIFFLGNEIRFQNS